MKKGDTPIKKKRFQLFHHQALPGTAPGTLIAHPDLVAEGIHMQVMAYDDNELVEHEISDPNEILPYLQKFPVTWLDVSGLGDIDVLQKIEQTFGFHPLAMEDVVNIHQRPKIEEYGDIMFGVTRMPQYIDNELELEQVSIFWGKNFVVTFQEDIDNGDCLDPLRARIKHGGRRQRLLRADYLAYAMIDTIIDSFFPILETYGTRLDEIEEAAILDPSSKVVVSIHDFKHELLILRRAAWSQREAIRSLTEIGKFADSDMRFFIRDCEDHTIQLIEILESYRERMSGLMDIYLSSVSNKMNSTMKILTALATIFMPLTVITGIYGMNFHYDVSPWNMPELGWYYGYPFALSLLVGTIVVLGSFFWYRGWFTK